MPKALELKPGQKFRTATNPQSTFVYIVPDDPDSDPAIVYNNRGRGYLSVSTANDIYTFNERFTNNPEVILTDEKITI